jgi:hypothetical protein
MAQGEGPEFKPQYQKKKKKEIKTTLFHKQPCLAYQPNQL